ncbi:MAG: hypothetical protein IPI81_00790 [Flavobacteriales bacterium]|nr:hypothetical protein [Flavobacteriales bacterium]
MDVFGFVMDHMGQFAPYDIPNLLFAVLSAAVLGYAMARWGAGASGPDARALVLWAASAALGTGFVRSQLPLAVGLLALVVLAKGNDGPRQERVLVFSALIFGLGCGSGASLIALAVGIPYILVVRWAFGVKRS